MELITEYEFILPRGFVDKDGDGFRDLSNGDQLVINFDFATQGVGGGEVELISNSWKIVYKLKNA